MSAWTGGHTVFPADLSVGQAPLSEEKERVQAPEHHHPLGRHTHAIYKAASLLVLLLRTNGGLSAAVDSTDLLSLVKAMGLFILEVARPSQGRKEVE